MNFHPLFLPSDFDWSPRWIMPYILRLLLIIFQDDGNTHFTLFEFRKMARKAKSVKAWTQVLSRGSVLKPCEYKRRWIHQFMYMKSWFYVCKCTWGYSDREHIECPFRRARRDLDAYLDQCSVAPYRQCRAFKAQANNYHCSGVSWGMGSSVMDVYTSSKVTDV
jgi:hypothetical protein